MNTLSNLFFSYVTFFKENFQQALILIGNIESAQISMVNEGEVNTEVEKSSVLDIAEQRTTIPIPNEPQMTTANATTMQYGLRSSKVDSEELSSCHVARQRTDSNSSSASVRSRRENALLNSICAIKR